MYIATKDRPYMDLAILLLIVINLQLVSIAVSAMVYITTQSFNLMMLQPILPNLLVGFIYVPRGKIKHFQAVVLAPIAVSAYVLTLFYSHHVSFLLQFGFGVTAYTIAAEISDFLRIRERRKKELEDAELEQENASSEIANR